MSELTPGLIIERRYRRYANLNFGNHADELFQKNIGGKYFINIFRYKRDAFIAEGWQPEVQFNMHGDGVPTFNVVLCSKMSIDDIEQFFAKIYERMECQPYDA